MGNLQNLESDLWEAADQLQANSKLIAAEYSQPFYGLIFLRHAYNRFLKVQSAIETTLPMHGVVRATLLPRHFQGKVAVYPLEKSLTDLATLKENEDIGKILGADTSDMMEFTDANLPSK